MATAPTVEVEAPAPASDHTPDEIRLFKQQALLRRDTGGAEVHYDSTPSPLAPGTGNNFNGLGQNGWIPYDAAIAIGPNHVLEMTNAQWAVYDRNGNQLTINQFDAWWGTQAGTPFDPKCFYDPAADRFVMLAVSKDNTQAFYHFSVSQTGDPTGSWFNYQLDARLDGATLTSNWSDFPQLGYDDNAVYLSANQFTLITDFFQYAKIRVFSKAQLYAGGALTYTDFTGMQNADNTLAFTMQPAKALSSVTSGYFLNSRSASGSNVTLWRLDNALTSPTLTRQATVAVGAYSIPPDAPQPITATLIATNDSRMLELAYRNGVLHGVFTEAVGGRAAMRFVGIVASSGILVNDISYTSASASYFFPAVSVDAAYNIYFVMSRSSSTEFASLYHTGIALGDTTIQSSTLLKAGVSTNTTGRWGDYSGIAIDPADPFSVWSAGGWANTSNRWATWNTQTTFGPVAPLTLTWIQPNNANRGVSGGMVLQGTGFTPGTIVNISDAGIVLDNFILYSSTEMVGGYVTDSMAPSGPRQVTVTNSNGTSNALTFTINAASPTLSGVGPNSGSPGQVLPVNLGGRDFLAGSSLTVDGTGVTVSNVNVVSGNNIGATFSIAPDAPGGSRNVTVTTPEGTSNSVVFTVVDVPPTLISTRPTNGDPATSLGMTILGTGFTPGSTVSISGSGISQASFSVSSNTGISGGFKIDANAAPGPRSVTVTNAIGVSNALTFTVNPIVQPPSLGSVSPNIGFMGSTVPVTLSGSNFTPTAVVSISGSGVTVTNLTFMSASELSADIVIAGDAATGPRSVTISTSNGTSNGLTFTVNLPPTPWVFLNLPKVMNPGKTVSVTLNGLYFVVGNTSINFTTGTGVTVQNLNVTNPIHLTADFVVGSNASLGGHSFALVTPGGTSNSLQFDVFNPPVINSVTPNSGNPGAAVPVTLSGMDFDASATVGIIGTAGVTVSSTQFVNASTITATFSIAPNAAQGGRSVIVTSSAGSSNAKTFTVNPPPPPPSLSSLTPNNGLIGATVPVTLNGANFDASAAINFTGAGVTVTNTQLVSANQLTANFLIAGNAASGGRNVTVTTNNGTSNGLTFTVNFPPPPTIASINPAVMNPNKTLPVTVTGLNFVTGATNVNLTTGTGVTVQNISVLSPTQLTADMVLAANASIGGHSFTVSTPAGISNSSHFDVFNPSVINSLVPNSAAQGSTGLLTVNGNFFYGGSTLQISGSGVTLTNIVRSNNSLITANYSVAVNATPGPRNVTVVNLAGTSAPAAFTVTGAAQPPTLTSVAPNNGNPGASVPVTLTGTNFDASATIGISGATGVTVSNTQFLNATTLTATFNIASNAAQGARNVTVTTANGPSNAQTFTVNPPAPPPPSLTSIVPNNGLIGVTVPVTLNGANFDASAAINLTGAGVTVTNTQFISANQLTANFVIAGNAASGGRTVTVTTANGPSNGLTFTINLPPTPTLSSIAPTVMNPNKTVPVTITGTNFVTAATNVNLTTGTGVSVQNISVLSTTQLTADIVLAANASIGGHFFTVSTPAGASNSSHFDVFNLPVISSLAPNSAAAGTSVSVTVNGANFYGGSTLQISGSGVTLSNITRANNNRITATFAVAPGATPGPRDVRVVNLGGASSPAVFTVP